MSCRDEQGRPESWLDRSHSYLSQRCASRRPGSTGSSATRARSRKRRVGTFIRLRNSLQWDETEGWGFGLKVRANILLPRVSERVRLLVTRDDLDEGFDDSASFADRDERTRLGLRFIASEKNRSQLDIDGTIGVSGGSLNPRVRARYRYVRGLSETTLSRATQSVFWERDEGLGTTSRLDWEWLPSRDRLLRWTGRGTFSEASEGVDWRTSLIGFQQLNSRTAVRLEGGLSDIPAPTSRSRNTSSPSAFGASSCVTGCSTSCSRNTPGRWTRKPASGRSDWRFTLTLEIQFENERSREYRLRRYLGDEAADLEEWSTEKPIPADAPGDRAHDPVLEEADEENEDPEPKEDP